MMRRTILSITAATFVAVPAFAQDKDIVDTAVEAGNFTTLVAAVEAAGLVETLKGEGPFTVFAPTDEAFAALPEGTVETLLMEENRDQLTEILTYHVVPGEVMSGDLSDGMEAETVARHARHDLDRRWRDGQRCVGRSGRHRSVERRDPRHQLRPAAARRHVISARPQWLSTSCGRIQLKAPQVRGLFSFQCSTASSGGFRLLDDNLSPTIRPSEPAETLTTEPSPTSPASSISASWSCNAR